MNILAMSQNLTKEIQCLCYWKIFVKFQPQKYDFNLNKGFLMEKMAQIH